MTRRALRLCSGDHQVVHAPGPDGLVGGYPITIQGSRVVLQLPESLTLAEAQSINSIGQQFDGIERIASDGTVHFAPREMSVLKKHLGYECRTMPLSEVDHWASELRARYAEYKRRVCAGGWAAKASHPRNWTARSKPCGVAGWRWWAS